MKLLADASTKKLSWDSNTTASWPTAESLRCCLADFEAILSHSGPDLLAQIAKRFRDVPMATHPQLVYLIAARTELQLVAAVWPKCLLSLWKVAIRRVSAIIVKTTVYPFSEPGWISKAVDHTRRMRRR